MAKRQIKYTNRDFDSIMGDIETYAKQYFPDYFNKFSSEQYSVEKLISELIAYQSDVLNYYIDDRFSESYLQYALETESVYRNAKRLGYKPQSVSLAIGEVEFSQLVPSVLSGSGKYYPDTGSAYIIKENTRLTNTSGENRYFVTEQCNMKEYSSSSVELTGSSGEPTYHRIFKNTKVRSGNRKQKTISVGSAESYRNLFVDKNVAFIESIVDSEGNKWYEVDYLGQDFILDKVENDGTNLEFEEFSDSNPYILKIKKVPRRFTVDHKSNGDCHVMFGAGLDSINEELQNISAYDILDLNELADVNTTSNIIADNFSNSDSYGLSPYNTSLTITYIVSTGEEENVKANNITVINNLIANIPSGVDNIVSTSLQVNNNESVSGASFINNIEKIRQDASKAFRSQNRCVTDDDFMIRAKMMPNRYGNISKVFVQKDDGFERYISSQNEKLPSNTINMYVLSKGSNGYLENSNMVTKNNLKTYIDQYRMAGVSVRIKDPYIVNFAIDFDYMVRRNYVKEEVLFNLFKVIENYFHFDKWEINQPIIVEDLKVKMFEVDGVASISNIKFTPKSDIDEGYSGVIYNMDDEMDKEKGIIYPPKDIGIFELKYPKQNITGTNV